ncbi:hypothetical protein F2Q70_00009740 [Brassica cretica]|uniref:Uncharacterized protein n=1 Tax=Brassica cretica TaxID=69181 RepID=A0A8S9MDH8_BRACR|nr:hypothetical protein F2Q70_00009740 [Brassica cretica]
MAVPRGDNGLMEEDEVDALIEENGVDYESNPELSSNLRDLAAAAQSGDVIALRNAIDDVLLDDLFIGFGILIDRLNGRVDEPLEDNDTALHLACLYGHLPCVQLLLERGANMEVKDEDEAIPLHDACAGGYLEIVELLFSRASGPECVKRMIETIDVEGDTPLHHAARGEHVNVIRLLLSSGASPTIKNSYGKTPGELADVNTDARRILEAAAISNSLGS